MVSLKKVGVDTAEFIKACRNLKEMLKGFGSFIGKVAEKEGDDLVQSMANNMDELTGPARIAGVIDDQKKGSFYLKPLCRIGLSKKLEQTPIHDQESKADDGHSV